MHLFDIPEEVIFGSILPKLSWNDLLRCRRVSTVLKQVTDGYLQTYPERAPEIEVNEADKTMADFLTLGIPTTGIFLKNVSGVAFFSVQAEAVGEFLERRGHLITHLRLEQLSLYVEGLERAFFQALPNLVSLEVGKFADEEEEEGNREEVKCAGYAHKPGYDYLFARKYPEVFRNLKKLRVGVDRSGGEERDIDHQTHMLHRFCAGLEIVALPFESSKPTTPEMVAYFRAELPNVELVNNTLIRMFENLKLIAEERSGQGKLVLSCYDLDHYNYVPKTQDWQHLERSGSVAFANLCEVYRSLGVTMRNVNALWLQKLPPNAFDGEFGSNILSLVNMHPVVEMLELPNVEEIRIPSTSQSSMFPSVETSRNDLEALKLLEITVDSKSMDKAMIFLGATQYNQHDHSFCTPPAQTKLLFRFFFVDHLRPNLVHLSLIFKPGGEEVIPRAEDIVASCPNLKIISLVNWPGTNKTLLKLWEGLRGLEEIRLDSCRQLGNVAFVGLDVGAPVFFKLGRLKKLSFLGLDRMPKVTDLLFDMVIRHLSLTHLTISSETPLEKVTPTGIRALLTGPFATSIEKFPFENWTLQGLSKNEFLELSKEFRSYRMI